MTFLSAATKNQQWKRVDAKYQKGANPLEVDIACQDAGLDLTPYYLNRAKAYWRDGLNTQEIADKLNMQEHHVYNNLERIKP